MNSVTLPIDRARTGAFRSRRRWAACCAALLALLNGWPPAALAQPTPGLSTVDAALAAQVRSLAQQAARGDVVRTIPSPRIEVEIGQFDPRLHLAPCLQVDPYLPEGTRLWGSTRMGLRCSRGTVKWNVYLPITVKAFAPALVATQGAAAGSTLTDADLTLAEVDFAQEPSAALTDASTAVGQVLARHLRPGQSLRQSHLKPRQWFGAGEVVTVVAQGPGFSVAGEAQALNPGIEGQPVRVRTESGRILTGQAVGEHRVALAP